MTAEQLIDLFPTRQRAQPQWRRLAAGGVQQKCPQGFEAGHPVKEQNRTPNVVKLDALRIKIGGAAQPSVERREVRFQMFGKLHGPIPLLQ